MILSPELFAQLEKEIDALVALNDDVLIDIIGQCCALKAKVVGQDERESDYRAILNFGHTIGHAIEMLTDYRQFLHGEAGAEPRYSEVAAHWVGLAVFLALSAFVYLDARRAPAEDDLGRDSSM